MTLTTCTSIFTSTSTAVSSPATPTSSEPGPACIELPEDSWNELLRWADWTSAGTLSLVSSSLRKTVVAFCRRGYDHSISPSIKTLMGKISKTQRVELEFLQVTFQLEKGIDSAGSPGAVRRVGLKAEAAIMSFLRTIPRKERRELKRDIGPSISPHLNELFDLVTAGNFRSVKEENSLHKAFSLWWSHYPWNSDLSVQVVYVAFLGPFVNFDPLKFILSEGSMSKDAIDEKSRENALLLFVSKQRQDAAEELLNLGDVGEFYRNQVASHGQDAAEELLNGGNVGEACRNQVASLWVEQKNLKGVKFLMNECGPLSVESRSKAAVLFAENNDVFTVRELLAGPHPIQPDFRGKAIVEFAKREDPDLLIVKELLAGTPLDVKYLKAAAVEFAKNKKFDGVKLCNLDSSQRGELIVEFAKYQDRNIKMSTVSSIVRELLKESPIDVKHLKAAVLEFAKNNIEGIKLFAPNSFDEKSRVEIVLEFIMLNNQKVLNETNLFEVGLQSLLKQFPIKPSSMLDVVMSDKISLKKRVSIVGHFFSGNYWIPVISLVLLNALGGYLSSMARRVWNGVFSRS